MMNNTEAEATLLALGPRLRWNDNKMLWFGWDFNKRHCYVIMYSTQSDKPFKCRAPKPANSAVTIVSFPTLADAKAACERHHATGKWEQ